MRESGYYWVKVSEPSINDETNTEDGWEVCYFLNAEDGGWYSIWDGGTYQDDELSDINKVKINR